MKINEQLEFPILKTGTEVVIRHDTEPSARMLFGLIPQPDLISKWEACQQVLLQLEMDLFGPSALAMVIPLDYLRSWGEESLGEPLCQGDIATQLIGKAFQSRP